MINVPRTKISDKRVHIFEDSLSKNEHLVSAEEDSAKTGKLKVWTLGQQLLAEP